MTERLSMRVIIVLVAKKKTKKKTYEASNLPSGVRPDGSKPNDLLGNVRFRISPAGVNVELTNPWGGELYIKTG